MYPLANEILAELHAQFPLLLRATKTANGASLAVRLPMLEEIARRLDEISAGPWVASSVRSYVMLCLEFLKLQRQLEQTGRYLLSTERETFDQVYNNVNVFGFYYLAGLLLTQALWPNHYGLATSFIQAFVPLLPSQAKILEVGVGTGFHLRTLATHVPKLEYEGLDLSQYAVDFARKYAFDGCAPPNVRFHLKSATDGLPFPDEHFDALVCGEVLEHVENPAALLREIRRVSLKGAPFFMTTVIFAANIDHIYLFEDARQIRTLLQRNGWAIQQEWIYPLYATDPETSRRPASYGALLRPV